MRYANGAQYDGYWLGGRKDGFGEYTFSNGKKYKGKFRFGKATDIA